MNSTFEWGMEKKASAHAHTHMYTRRVYIVFGETATPRVCSKSDNVALERRFVNTLEKMRGGGWYSLSFSVSLWGYEYLSSQDRSPTPLLESKNFELGVLPSATKRLSRPRSGPGCFERLLIAATRLSWCVVTILGVMGRLRFLEKLMESEWNGFCYGGVGRGEGLWEFFFQGIKY